MEANTRAKTMRRSGAVPITTMSSDLQFEILIRLPDGRSALRCAAVCKEWHSVVTDLTFRLRFTEHHNQLLIINNNNNAKLPSDIIFTTHAHAYIGPPPPPTSLNYLSEGVTSSTYLSFLPGWPSVTVRSSSSDLLLVELHPNQNENRSRLCVCNPVTKSWISLPDPPPPPSPEVYYGFTTQAASSSSVKYRVVLLLSCQQSRIAVFRSETGRWDPSFSRLELDPNHSGDLSFLITRIVPVGRLIYFPMTYKTRFEKLAVIDTFSESSSLRLLELPRQGFGIRTWRSDCFRVCIGAVRGRLRVCQSHCYEKRDMFEARIWELEEHDYDNSVASWVLVRKIVLQKVKAKMKELCVRAFHPQDDDVLFVVDLSLRDTVWKYQISGGSFEKIGMVTGITSYFDCCLSHVLVHPPWPTLIPALIPSTSLS